MKALHGLLKRGETINLVRGQLGEMIVTITIPIENGDMGELALQVKFTISGLVFATKKEFAYDLLYAESETALERLRTKAKAWNDINCSTENNSRKHLALPRERSAHGKQKENYRDR